MFGDSKSQNCDVGHSPFKILISSIATKPFREFGGRKASPFNFYLEEKVRSLVK